MAALSVFAEKLSWVIVAVKTLCFQRTSVHKLRGFVKRQAASPDIDPSPYPTKMLRLLRLDGPVPASMSETPPPTTPDGDSPGMHEAARREKLRQLVQLGINPWGQRFDDHLPIAEIRAREGEITVEPLAEG